MSKVVMVPPRMENKTTAFEWLANLQESAQKLWLDELTIDFSNTTWFEAQLAAGLGAVLSDCEVELNSVKINNLKLDVERILRKNQFLVNYGFDPLLDKNDTTIPFKRFPKGGEKAFKAYIDSDLLSKQELPTMSELLQKRISESIIEIFINASTHSGASNVFCCGQYYPQKKRLDFCIVNTGKTFKENVTEFLEKTVTAQQAIVWAVEEGNTTRTGEIPGGLGLATIRDFIKLNEGKIQIISDTGMWEQSGDKVSVKALGKEFLGTIVILEVNINDTKSYRLSGEQKN